MNKKTVIIILLIVILSIILILLGLFFPNNGKKNNSKKGEKYSCSITKKDKYYVVSYNSNYDDYSMVNNIYEVFDNKDKLKEVLDKKKCDVSKIDIDFSSKNALVMETLIDPKLKTIKIEDKNIKVIINYKIKDKGVYNLFVMPVDKDIENYDIRIFPSNGVERPSSNE